MYSAARMKITKQLPSLTISIFFRFSSEKVYVFLEILGIKIVVSCFAFNPK